MEATVTPNRSRTPLLRRIAAFALPLALALGLALALAACEEKNPGVPQNPAPTLTSLSPEYVPTGTPGQEIVLAGEGFIRASVARVNGAPRPTTYLDRQNLIATLPPADLLAAGTLELRVVTPGPGGGESAPKTVQVVTATRPTPVLATLLPDSVTIGRPFTLEVRGAGFDPASVIWWGDEPRATTYLTSARLRAEISAADVAHAGAVAVTVRTPPPGGGTSAALNLVATPPPATPLRLLFMGNSLTAANGLPEMVDSLAAAAGLYFKSTEMTSGNYALVDHYDHPERRALVSAGPFDYVIMQQGPSSLPESRVLLIDGVRLWKPLILAGGARPALYAVWPEKARMNVFPDVSESYRLAAVEVNGLFFPVGDTWLETWARLPAAALYGPDDFHPSVAGTYAAAVVIVSILGHRDPETLPARFNPGPALGTPPDGELGATIRAAAGAVIGRLAGR